MSTQTTEIKSRKILVAEDSKMAAAVMKNWLQDWNYDYSIVSDGQEAWEYILENKPKMLLLDWHLPSLDGIDICRKLRSHTEIDYSYVIMVTSMDNLADVIVGLETGADDYVTKPFEPRLLRARIDAGWRVIDLNERVAEKVETLAKSNTEQKRLIAKLEEQNRIITKQADDLESAQKQLLDTARRAGMAEIATSVLHNIGNILNTAVTSTVVVNEVVQGSRLSTLNKLSDLIKSHEDNFSDYVRDDPKGRQIPKFLAQLVGALGDEHRRVSEKIGAISESHGYIVKIISLQQSYAGVSGVKERIPLATAVEEVAELYVDSFDRHQIKLTIQKDDDLPIVLLERSKFLQIVMNMLQNARDALRTIDREKRKIIVGLTTRGTDSVGIAVTDNGSGIKDSDLNHIFNYGFTTKSDGHGFGLHGCANLATELGGKLQAKSDGPGKGATFELILPIK